MSLHVKDQQDRIVRPKEAVVITGRSLASLHRDEKAGRFPARISIGPNARGWRLSQLMAWLEERQTDKDAPIKPVAPGAARRGRKPANAVTKG